MAQLSGCLASPLLYEANSGGSVCRCLGGGGCSSMFACSADRGDLWGWGGNWGGRGGGSPNQAPVPLIAQGRPDSHPLCSQAGTPTPLNSPKS